MPQGQPLAPLEITLAQDPARRATAEHPAKPVAERAGEERAGSADQPAEDEAVEVAER